MARPTKRELELLDIIDGLQARMGQLQEAISPGRIQKFEYYIEVAKRFRESAAKHENTITTDWTPTRPRVIADFNKFGPTKVVPVEVAWIPADGFRFRLENSCLIHEPIPDLDEDS